MRRIVNRKLYDTDAATLLHEYSGHTGFFPLKKRLYKTKKGNYFLVITEIHWGREAGEHLLALTPEKAMKRLEDDGEIDALLKLFGDEIEEA